MITVAGKKMDKLFTIFVPHFGSVTKSQHLSPCRCRHPLLSLLDSGYHVASYYNYSRICTLQKHQYIWLAHLANLDQRLFGVNVSSLIRNWVDF